jgi:threonyl-tRNA synthetase
MVDIRLPDDSVRSYPGAISGMEIAESISSGLAKNSLAIKVDGALMDLSTLINNDASVEIIVRGKGNTDAIELVRHDCAHVMAEAVQSLFPGTQVTIGPSIENGFYYDFYRSEPFTSDDLETIEKRMHEIIARDAPFERKVVSRQEAIELFKSKGEEFKVELIEYLPKDQEISLYSQGDWLDLCRGPHSPSTGKIGKAFKLMSVAGAYWRGDSSRAQLQRIYGTCWEDSKQLKAHLTMLEEAAKRDHRKLGKEMDLFHLQEEAVGSVFWHPKGWTTYRMMETYMRNKLEAADYVEVKTPQLVDRKLWEASGHWEKFRENMFTSEDDDSDRILALKPMNCPCHVQIFNQGIKSYRDLPLRMAEFGSCHRNEPSGALHGIMRVRNFTQDDAHIFCTEDQIEAESVVFCDLLLDIYKDFGFTEVSVKFSDRPDVRAGSDETWDRSEAALKQAIEAAGLPYTMNPGEGAFYGPKLEFVLKDAIGRDWQCGTLQVDFVLPERLDALYVDADGERKRPVMLHRAILGSFERFMGMLIENYAGRLPLWLSPVQCVVAPITSDANGYAEEIHAKLVKSGIRATMDLRNEKINYKIREHSRAKVPVMFIVGRQEMEKGTVAQRVLAGKEQEFLALDDAVNRLLEETKIPG